MYYTHFYLLLLISVVSCVVPNGLTLKRHGHISDTGRGDVQCVSCSAESVHLSGQTSSRIPPNHSDKASPLYEFDDVP